MGICNYICYFIEYILKMWTGLTWLWIVSIVQSFQYSNEHCDSVRAVEYLNHLTKYELGKKGTARWTSYLLRHFLFCRWAQTNPYRT